MIIAAADGSSLSNPGPAGWAWYVSDDIWASGGWEHGTNNMAELMAVLDLLQSTAHTPEPLRILCDSQYVINSLTKWMPGWKRRGWKKGDGKPVLNVELMKELDAALAGRAVEFEWVKGHAGHAMNEAADARARAAAEAFQRGDEPDAGPGFPSATAAARDRRFEPRSIEEEPDLFSVGEPDPEPAAVSTPGAASPRMKAQFVRLLDQLRDGTAGRHPAFVARTASWVPPMGEWRILGIDQLGDDVVVVRLETPEPLLLVWQRVPAGWQLRFAA